jgi:hypothetical protein
MNEERRAMTQEVKNAVPRHRSFLIPHFSFLIRLSRAFDPQEYAD